MENRRIKILAIDDNNDNLISLKALIREAFPEVVTFTALDGKKGIELAIKENPDVILLDIIMPEMDGYEVCKVLKEDENLFDIPVIFITALKGDSESRVKALESGGDAFLAKPIDQSELTAQIRAMIKIKNANFDKRFEKEKLIELVEEQTLELKAIHIATLNLMEDLKKEVEIRKENEAFLKETQQIAKLGTYSLDVVSGKWKSSEILDTIFGIDSDYDKTVEGWVTITHPDWQTIMNDYFINEVLGKKNTFNKEYKIVNQKNKTEHWVHGIGNLKLDVEGNPITMIGTIKDITEQKQEEIYRELSREILQILNKSDDIRYSTMRILSTIKTFTGFDAVGIRMQADEDFPYFIEKGFSDSFILKENSLIERDANGGICRNNDGEACLECICGLVLSDKTEPTNPLFTKGGSCYLNNSTSLLEIPKCDNPFTNPRNRCLHEGYLSIALIPIKAKKKIIGLIQLNDKKENQFTSTIIDILEGIASNIGESLLRKQAEESMHNSEKKYRNIFENAREGIFQTNTNGTYISVNPVLAEMYGYSSPEDLINSRTNISKEAYFNPEERANFLKIIEEKGYIKGYEYEVVRKDGGKIWFYEDAHAIKDDSGNTKYYEGFVIDITERKKSVEDLIKAKDKAEESDRLKSAFLANMSHEIRTPMNGILGFADLLKEPHLSDEKQQYYISIIEKSGIRMLNIINNIISISKIESGTMEVYISETNINEQLDYIYTFFKPEVEQKSLNLSYKNTLHDNHAYISSDKEKLYGILTNLVKNAIKFTDRGSIEFGYNLKDNYLIFYVKDTGIGVPTKRQEAIFDRFIQADIEDKRAFQGAGLGLSISKAYVEMLGGKMWLESKEGKGSTFYFTIPYNNTRILKENAITVDSNITTKTMDNRNLKVLVVEDDEVSDFYITTKLKSFCREILHADNGMKAIEICQNNLDLDLLLMDINMPEMNGLEATKQIRKFNKDVVIIAQTAYALKGDREKAIEAGCNSYITKPIESSVLLELIKKYFGDS